MPQRFETAVAHIALYRLGAVAMPLSMLFGPDALEYRINDSEARLAHRRRERHRQPARRARRLPAAGDGDRRRRRRRAAATSTGRRARGRAAAAFGAGRRRAPTIPAVLIYTSGTTGPPKGALIPHRALIGNLPGFVCSQNWFPQDDAVFWSPADWAWTGGLMDALLPTLYFGRDDRRAAAAASRPRLAFELMERHRVTHTFLFPTALKAMMKAVPEPRERYRAARCARS